MLSEAPALSVSGYSHHPAHRIAEKQQQEFDHLPGTRKRTAG